MPNRKTDTQFLRRTIIRKPQRVAIRGPILIVDDNADDANLAKRAFERLNPQFAITILGSGHELVAHLQGVGASSEPTGVSAPAVVLLDLRMPEMDGFAVMDWITKQPQHASIPVIAMTNFDDLQHLKRAYASGVRSYLLKPIREEALRSAVSSLSISI
jgi:two-component system response regulator